MSENCLQRADEIVHGDRNAAYGEPADNHTTTAEMVSAAWRKKYPWFQEIDAEDVCFFNILQKISREMNAAGDDGPVDICGYAANVEIVRKGWSVAEIRKERLQSSRQGMLDSCDQPDPDDLPPHGDRVQVTDIEDETDTVLSDEPTLCPGATAAAQRPVRHIPGKRCLICNPPQPIDMSKLAAQQIG